ncbi:MAG: hypothetical protein RLZZ210_377 [Pseudomonadota bacterium]|jgi:hypothetical protein
MITTTVQNCRIKECTNHSIYKVETKALLDTEMLLNLKRGSIYTDENGIVATYACGSTSDKKSHVSLLISRWEKINRIRFFADLNTETIRIISVSPDASSNNSMNMTTIIEE